MRANIWAATELVSVWIHLVNVAITKPPKYSHKIGLENRASEATKRFSLVSPDIRLVSDWPANGSRCAHSDKRVACNTSASNGLNGCEIASNCCSLCRDFHFSCFSAHWSHSSYALCWCFHFHWWLQIKFRFVNWKNESSSVKRDSFINSRPKKAAWKLISSTDEIILSNFRTAYP